MIPWSNVMSPNGCIPLILPTKFDLYVFFKTSFFNTENWLYKARQLLKNEIKNSYYKVIIKCDKNLLQSASGIKKCDRLLLQSASGFTKCNSYYKVRRNKGLFFDGLFPRTSKIWGFFFQTVTSTSECLK